MPEARVTMNVRQISPAVSIIDIRGELTGFAREALLDAYARADAGATRVVSLNLTGLEYMTSGCYETEADALGAVPAE